MSARETVGKGAGAGPFPPAWPFEEVGHQHSGAGSKTLGADVITWRGRLPGDAPAGGRTIVFTTRPRAIDARATFLVPSNARIQYATEHAQFVDVHVHHALTPEERAALQELAQAQDTRPVLVRCAGERVRGAEEVARESGAPAASPEVLDLFRDQPPSNPPTPHAGPSPSRDPRLPDDPPEIVYSEPWGWPAGALNGQQRYVHLYTHCPAYLGFPDAPPLRFYRGEHWAYGPDGWRASVTGKPGPRHVHVYVRLDVGPPHAPAAGRHPALGGRVSGDRMRFVASLDLFERAVLPALRRHGAHAIVAAALAADQGRSVATAEQIAPHGGADQITLRYGAVAPTPSAPPRQPDPEDHP